MNLDSVNVPSLCTTVSLKVDFPSFSASLLWSRMIDLVSGLESARQKLNNVWLTARTLWYWLEKDMAE